VKTTKVSLLSSLLSLSETEEEEEEDKGGGGKEEEFKEDERDCSSYSHY
jgi:hypothetical protein